MELPDFSVNYIQRIIFQQHLHPVSDINLGTMAQAKVPHGINHHRWRFLKSRALRGWGVSLLKGKEEVQGPEETQPQNGRLFLFH